MNPATSKSPLVSIVIPAYNEERNISQCLESISKQSYRNIEVIIVNDKSVDKTVDIANETGIKTGLNMRIVSPNIHQERGVVRNLGAKYAKGEYLLFIDADMHLEVSVVEECVDMMISGIDGVIIPEISIGKGFWAKCKSLEKRCYQGDDRIEAARFFNKKKFWSIGGWDQSMISGEDWDLTQRYRGRYPIERINSHILHNEGELSFFKSIKKKFYYATKADSYLSKHPMKTIDFLLFVLRPAYFKSWKVLLSDPLHAAGMFLLKSFEFTAGLAGLILYRLGFLR